VLILTMHAEEQYARRASKLAPPAYITKNCSRAELVNGTSTKYFQGGRMFSPALAEKFGARLGWGSDRPRHETLSDREFEVMRPMATGKR